MPIIEMIVDNGLRGIRKYAVIQINHAITHITSRETNGWVLPVETSNLQMMAPVQYRGLIKTFQPSSVFTVLL
jgi:hypothetical protein